VTREVRTGFWAGESNGKNPVEKIRREDNIEVDWIFFLALARDQ
jgi:hypothetical protein